MTDNNAQTDPASQPAIDENFHFLAYPANILVWTSNSEGLCSFVSPSWTTFTGRQRAAELGRGWLEKVHPDDREVLVRRLNEAHHGQQPFRLMFRYLREDGVARWLVSQGLPQTTPTDEFIGHLCLCFDVTPYQEGEAAMECSVQNVLPLLKQTRLIAVVLDIRGRVQFSNGALCRLLQHGGSELMDCSLFERYLAPGDRGLLEKLYPGGTQSAHFPAEFQSELLTGENETCHVSWHSVIWREFSGQVKGAVLIGDDVTAMRREEEQTSLYVKAFEATDHAIVVTDVAGTIVSVNRAFSALTGYGRDEALGSNPRILQSGRHDQAFYRQLWATLLETGHWHGDMWDRHKDGSTYPKYLAISAIRNSSDAVTNYVGIFYDNSERKTVEERLDHLAHYDALTGAPNRCLLLDRVDQALERAIRFGTKVALLYIDLDHFKQVNDTYGHDAGDELLKAATQRMTTCVRGADTIARLGGDEFVVLVPDINGIDDVRMIARKLLETLSPPYAIEGHAVVSTPSIGISVYPDDGNNWKELMKHADAAMYRAKQSGRANFKFFPKLASPEKKPD